MSENPSQPCPEFDPSIRVDAVSVSYLSSGKVVDKITIPVARKDKMIYRVLISLLGKIRGDRIAKYKKAKSKESGENRPEKEVRC